MINIQGFIKKYQGKFATDQFGLWRGQCVSLAKQWQKANGWTITRGNAIQWANNGDGKNYKFIKNTAALIPKTGDMAIFSVPQVTSKGVRYDYGHIGIVVSATVKTMKVFNQNWPHGNTTDPATVTTFDYLKPKCVGFLRKI